MPTDKTNQIKVDPGQVYLITGKSLQKLLDTIKAGRPIAGDNITLQESKDGLIVNGA